MAGFGKNLSLIIKCIYSNCESCVINNGHISRFFFLERGLHQGCPLSPYLFVLVVELLSREIRNDNKIKGIKILNIECKIKSVCRRYLSYSNK